MKKTKQTPYKGTSVRRKVKKRDYSVSAQNKVKENKRKVVNGLKYREQRLS